MKHLIAILFTFALCGSAVTADEIAFFYALDPDLHALKSEGIVVRNPVKIGDRTIQIISIGKHKIYAVKMGSGAVETAISAQALLCRFHCDRAFSLGPVGALSDKLQVGQWCRVVSVSNFQKGAWTESGFQKADAIEAADGADLTDATLPKLFQKLPTITVASGEVFVSSTAYRGQLREQTKADVVDMNLFGLLAACSDHHQPVINYRIISDKADDEAGHDFRKFVQAYDGAGGRALAELIHNLPSNPNSPESYPELQKLLKEINP